MKREGNIFSKIINRGNLLNAHMKASKGKSHYTAVELTNEDLENKINEIQYNLKNNLYTLTRNDYSFEIINDKGKERELYKLNYFPHRIIQWAIMNVTMSIFTKTFTTDTYASMKNRGIHLVLKKLKRSLCDNPEETRYCLKIDIKKFYPNINNNILMNKLERKFKDKEFLNLMRIIIFSMGNKGQPIGSLLSQYLANFYLSSFDHHCKEIFRIKYYYRYMDDIVILHKDKKFLHNLKKEFDLIFERDYDLKIKENWQVFPVDSRGIDFVGYRFFHNKVIVRKRIYKRARYIFSRQWKHKATPSYYGWCKHANVHKFLNKYSIYKKEG